MSTLDYDRAPQAERRRMMKAALLKLQQEDPERYADLLKRAQNAEYNRQVMAAEKIRLEAERRERLRREREERERYLRVPVMTGLPDIDLSGVHGMLAFRVWHWNGHGLKSTAQSYVWREVNFADRKPSQDNDRGLHCVALSSLGVLDAGSRYFGQGTQEVSGFVEVLGHYEEHTDGVIRAEIARMVCLFVTSANASVCEVVRDLYARYPVTPVFVLNPEQLGDTVLREVLRQKYVRRV